MSLMQKLEPSQLFCPHLGCCLRATYYLHLGSMSVQYLLIDSHHDEIVATYPKMSEAMDHRDQLPCRTVELPAGASPAYGAAFLFEGCRFCGILIQYVINDLRY
jgi:hypothetical protein